MLYYDDTFHFDPSLNLKVDGYYEIREMSGSYTTNGKDYYSNKPIYGFLQFFRDGFCKVGRWNGMFESSADIKKEMQNNNPHGYWGIYKIKGDTLYIEYLYTPASPGVDPSEERNTLVGLIKENKIIVTFFDNAKYSFPDIVEDSLTSSCIGKYVGLKSGYDMMDNYLKRNIAKYQ